MPLCIPYRHLLRIASKRTHQRYFSTTQFCLKDASEKVEILSDQRLQAMVAELEESNIKQSQDVLLESIETFKPNKQVLNTEEMDKLFTVFDKSFSVRQLSDYSAVHKLPRHKRKKRQLIDGIVKKHWGLQTTKEFDAARKQATLERQRDTVKETFPATFQQMFFIIGNNGETLRTIEDNHQVVISIDVEKKEYTIEGRTQAVMEAKQDILTHLNILQEEMDAPDKVQKNEQLLNQVDGALVDISRLTGSFISLEDGKFSLTSTLDENLNNAKRLLHLTLTEMNATSKKPLDSADQTIAPKNLEFTVLPFQDENSMAFYDKNLNWNTLAYTNKQEQDDYVVLDGQEVVGSIDNIKDLLVKPLDTSSDAISMEARFGKLLFQESASLGNSTDLGTLFKNRSVFLNSIPPRKLTTPYMPIIRSLDGGFHQRAIQLEYVNQSLLFGADNSENPDVKRLLVEFLIQEDGNMNVKKITAEKNRSVIDVLGLHGNVDVRLMAKQYLDYTKNTAHVQELIDQCKLISYGEISAPKQQHILNESLVLSDIAYINKKRYLFEDGLISVNHVEQQDKRVKRTEMTLTSVEPQTLDTSNSIERWPSFANILNNIARKWDYTS